MSPGREGIAALLRWYPKTWRERYGEELVAVMEDDLGGRPPSLRFKVSIALAGLRERARGTGLIGDQPSPAERTRAGSLLVLCSWVAFVLAGMSFSKVSEHFAQAVPVASRSLAQNAFTVLVALSVLGGALVVLGGLAALPACARFVRVGGWWPVMRGHLVSAAVLTVSTVATLIPLAVWAHHLSGPQRNGDDGTYSAAIAAWAVLVAAMLAQWTATVVAVGRRIDLIPAPCASRPCWPRHSQERCWP